MSNSWNSHEASVVISVSFVSLVNHRYCFEKEYVPLACQILPRMHYQEEVLASALLSFPERRGTQRNDAKGAVKVISDRRA